MQVGKSYAVFVFITLLALLVSCSDTSQKRPASFSIGGSTMGTSWSMRWVDGSPQAGKTDTDVIEKAMIAELSRINALMSTWDPNSQLSNFNNLRSVEPVALHDDTLNVIDAALSVSRLTGGRYDVTLQPVIELWGFNRDTDIETPETDDIIMALEASGYQQLVRIASTVRKRRPDIAIDVSSLAKGYAVDKLGDIAESFGITRYLVEIGGEVRTRGRRADGSLWRIGVENPYGDVPQLIALHDMHVASSGSYRNYRIENGKRLSHIIDGKTGRPIEHDLVAVTVVHESTMLADAWATALLVVGEVRALELIDTLALVAQLTSWRDGKFEQVSTTDFDALLLVDD